MVTKTKSSICKHKHSIKNRLCSKKGQIHSAPSRHAHRRGRRSGTCLIPSQL